MNNPLKETLTAALAVAKSTRRAVTILEGSI